MNILVVNDDGIMSPGIEVLRSFFLRHGEHVLTVAPATNQSGRSGAITLLEPLDVLNRGENLWAVTGTPVDSVRVALTYLGYQPDLIASGINHGSNLADDVYASGTVGAAHFGCLHGIPAIALSAASEQWSWTGRLLERHWPIIRSASASALGVLNVNFPAHGGLAIVHALLAPARHRDELLSVEKTSIGHRITLQSVAGRDPSTMDRKTDLHGVQSGLVTLTDLALSSTLFATNRHATRA